MHGGFKHRYQQLRLQERRCELLPVKQVADPNPAACRFIFVSRSDTTPRSANLLRSARFLAREAMFVHVFHQFDQWIEEARGTLDTQRRQKLYSKVQWKLYEDAAVIFSNACSTRPAVVIALAPGSW